MTNKPSETHAGYQNAMVKSLVDGGYWTGRMELFYVLAQEGTASTELSLNWVAPTGSFNLSDAGSVNPYEHAVQYQGIDFNGTDDYLSTQWNHNTNSVNVGAADLTLAVWFLSGSTAPAMGAYQSGIFLQLWPRNSGQLQAYINSAEVSNLGSQSATTGFAMITRRGATELEGYFNGTSIGTASHQGYGATNRTVVIGGSNDEGSINTHYDGIISIVMIMDAVSDSDATAIYNILDTYMTAIGN